MPAASRSASAAAWEVLSRVHVTVMRQLQAAQVWAELRPVEFEVLTTLARCPGQSLRLVELNRHVLVSQPSLSRLVARLAARGLVDRRPEPRDGRGTVVRLTPQGAALHRRVGGVYLAAVHRLVGAELDDGDLAGLGALAERLCTGVEGAAGTTVRPWSAS